MAKNTAAATADVEGGPKRFDLARPYEYRGTRYETFTLREPKIRDVRIFLKAAESDTILAVEGALANLAGVDHPVMGELSPRDFGKMKAWFEHHLSDLAG